MIRNQSVEQPSDIHLIASTGDARVDAILRGTASLFALLFPGRIRAIYVEGSHADATGLATSDLDLTIIFRDRFIDEDEAMRARQVLGCCAALSAIEYDAAAVDEAALAHGAWPLLKLASLLVWGEDVRDQMALDLAAWTRDRMHTSYWRLGKLFGRSGVVRPPLGYPDPAGEFFGYDARTMRLPDGREIPTTRDLIRATGWAATALLAHQTGRFVARKADCARMYREHIGGEWAPLLDELYANCRGLWQYRLPEDPAERAYLHDLCARTLGFERHFLAIYKDYVLSELRGPDLDGHLRSLEVLGYVPFADPDVLFAVRALAEREGAAPHTLARLVAGRIATALGEG
jgi:hypothetical protein